jgi:geranylgeranyl diphosphate synthase type II
MSGVPAFFAEYQERTTRELTQLLGGGEPAGRPRVEQAMAYTALAPSKQVRAVLVLLCAELCRGRGDRAVAAACAIELVHASSLILDDLPAMDDAPLRRGRRANHLEFGEATAILAAFGLLNLAYGVIATYPAPLASQMTTLLSQAVGPAGLIGGQALDLEATDQTITFERLERIHRGKTGALFVAAATCGALTAGAAPDAVAALQAYAKNLGLAFQIVDDLLDVAGTTADTGKAVRADARKTTFVSFSGIDGARQLAAELCETADRALTPFGAKADRLRELSAFVAARRL